MATSSILLHIPHSSVLIPQEHLSDYRLSAAELADELLRMTDAYTSELFQLPGADRLEFQVSRLLVDPERFENDADEKMASRGMGVLYTKTHDGRDLRTVRNREELLDRYYRPHHCALAAWTAGALEEHGRCLILDCHSYPSQPLPCDRDPMPDRPDFCLGTDPFHTPAWLVDQALDIFRTEGCSVLQDRPYDGSIVPQGWYQKDVRVSSLMVEINRKLYMEEGTGKRSGGFQDLAGTLRRALAAIAKAWDPEDSGV